MPRIVRLFILSSIAKLALPLSAALPGLSSIEPLEFDEASKRVVARGDARLDLGSTQVRADEITYYQEFSLADAIGNIAINRDGYRLLADRLSFDAQNSIASVQVAKSGQWPFYITAATIGGTEQQASVEGATIYYGNPSDFGLSVSSDRIEFVNDSSPYVTTDSAVFRIGSIPFFYLPSYTYYLDGAPYFLDIGGGLDDELGAYLQTTALFPITSWLRAGVNFDVYSKRGILAGPAAQYRYDVESQQIVGAFSTGYINDQGEPEEDLLGDPVDVDRGFVEWRHRHNIGERINLTASASYWSDSEATRDFRDDFYNDYQRPDTFAEGVYAGDNYFVSVFGRFRPNDFQLVQERLPEISFDLLPVPILNTGAYHRLSADYARLREDFDRLIAFETTESDRFDLSYRIERPFRLTDWLTVKPLAGARVTHYANQQIDPLALGLNNEPNATSLTATDLLDDTFTREIYELGFDLEARAYANYDTVNETWAINGLRHLVRPVLKYRFFSDPDALNQIAVIDRQSFDLNRPILNLSDIRSVDSIEESHLARLGVENLFQTRAEGYGSRTLAALNFYQDILFEKSERYDGGEQETFDATWIELVLNPAPWLKFDMASRFKTTSLTLEELRTRTTIKSGEIWEIAFSTDLLNQQLDQYRLDFIYRINERYSFLADTRFDAESGQFTSTRVGLHTRIGGTWEILYALIFRDGARRESDIEFNIRVSLSNF